MTGPAAPSFSPATFRFFAELKRNNRREWFLANRERYERDVRQPALAFLRALAPKLRAVAPNFVVSLKTPGGTLRPIHRDLRFTKDKTPYKTRLSARVYHAAGHDVHAPGFYLSVGPDDCSAAAGIWHPPAPELRKLREAIARAPGRWTRTLAAAKRAGALPWGESISRVPRGFPKDHPLAAELRRVDFFVYRDFTRRDVCAPDFLARYLAVIRTFIPFQRFLLDALGLPWSSARQD